MKKRWQSQTVYWQKPEDIVAFSVAGDAGQIGVFALTDAASRRVISFVQISAVLVAEVAVPAAVAYPVNSRHHCCKEQETHHHHHHHHYSYMPTSFTSYNMFNPLKGTLKPQSNGPLYSNTVIGKLAVDGRWRFCCKDIVTSKSRLGSLKVIAYRTLR